MTLGFQTKWKNGKPTYFIEKILSSISYVIPLNEFYQLFDLLKDKGYVNVLQYAECDPKHHTIREDNTNRWKAGRLIHFVIGNRTKKRFQFAPVIPVISTQTIFFNYGLTNKFVSCLFKIPKKDLEKPLISTEPNIFIDERLISKKEAEQLAINDGFDSYESFIKYFDREFSGKIIHWTNLKY